MTVTTWKCEVCGYIHTGPTPPDVCPVCGVGPELFSPYEVVEEAPPVPPASALRCTVCEYVAQGPEPPEICPVCGAGRDMFEPLEDTVLGTVGRDPGHIVVLGAGIAGVTAAESARRVSDRATITLVSKEPGLPYYRLNLTRYVAGEVPEKRLELCAQDWFSKHRVQLVHGEAVFIQRSDQQVALRDGRTLAYDRLVLANGAHPFMPPIAGLRREGVLALRTLEDAKIIAARGESGEPACCIGGGLLGLETAGGLAARGAPVIVLESFDWLLPRQLARPAAERLQQRLEGLGVGVRCGVRIKEILGDEGATGVLLESGEVVPARLVVVAAGVRPNSYLARQSGLEVRTGVVVDDEMTTSDRAVLAAGDVAEHRGRLYGLWSAAYAQGIVAGARAAGGAASFKSLAPATTLKVVNMPVFSMGEFLPPDGSYTVLEGDLPGNGYYRLVCRDGRIVGANLLGDTSFAPEIKAAVQDATQIEELVALKARFPGLGAA